MMISSRIGLLGQGCVVMILAACAGCSSSSGSSGAPPGNPDASGSSSGGSSGGSGDGSTASNAVVDGGGGSCPALTYPVSVGTIVNTTVSWNATAAVAKGSGAFYIWLLTTYSIDATGKISGNTVTCGNQPAVLTLSQTGDIALQVPSGQSGQIKPEYPADSWDGITPTAITGTLGGTNIGSSFEVDPSVTLIGLKPTDALSDPMMKWPTSNTALTQTDLTYPDGGAYVTGQGHPGVRGIFDPTPPFYLSGTSLSQGSPRADQFWSVTRTQLALYGTSTTCTETKGTATVTLINNRIVGCEISDDGGACTADEYGFLDGNTTQYTPAASGNTFDSKNLTAGATCADVLTALPAPTM
jgi:hypothetical protein